MRQFNAGLAALLLGLVILGLINPGAVKLGPVDLGPVKLGPVGISQGGFARTALADGLPATAPAAQDQGVIRLANPASVHCEHHGGRLTIREDDSGSVGLCTLPNGVVCEEWDFFRGECGPGDHIGTTETPEADKPKDN